MGSTIDAELRRAEAHRKAGRLDDALAGYQAILEAAPERAEAHAGRGATLAMLGRLDEAVASFEAAVELDPELTRGWYNMGVALQTVGAMDRAVACFERVIAIDPDHDTAHGQLGLLHARRGEVERGIALLERAVALRPDHPGTRHNLATVLATHHRHGDAIAHFDAALGVAPHLADSLRSRAASKDAVGDAEGAIHDYRRALEERPDDFEALNNLGCLLQAPRALERCGGLLRDGAPRPPKRRRGARQPGIGSQGHWPRRSGHRGHAPGALGRSGEPRRVAQHALGATFGRLRHARGDLRRAPTLCCRCQSGDPIAAPAPGARPRSRPQAACRVPHRRLPQALGRLLSRADPGGARP